jgi:hypothetical protein
LGDPGFPLLDDEKPASIPLAFSHDAGILFDFDDP